MPVDFFPLIFSLLTAVGVLTTIGVVIFRRRRRLSHTILCAIFLIIPWPTLYVWMYERAEILYSAAASRGDPEAEYRLGFSCMNYAHGAGWDPAKGVQLLERASASGHAKAQMTLGCYILTGSGSAPDQSKALALFDKAAQSIPDAAVIASEVRAHGYDVNQSTGVATEIAVRWIMKRH